MLYSLLAKYFTISTCELVAPVQIVCTVSIKNKNIMWQQITGITRILRSYVTNCHTVCEEIKPTAGDSRERDIKGCSTPSTRVYSPSLWLVQTETNFCFNYAISFMVPPPSWKEKQYTWFRRASPQSKNHGYSNAHIRTDIVR